MAKRKPASETVIDHEPLDGSTTIVPTEEEPGPIIKPSAIWSPPKGEVAFEHPTLAELAVMKTEYLALLDDNKIETPDGYEAVRKAIGVLRPLRTGVDEKRLECGSEAREYVKRVNAAGNLLIQRIEEIEKPLKAAKDKVDHRAAEEALAKAMAIEAEQKRLEDARLAAIQAEKDKAEAERLAKIKAQEEELASYRKKLEEERSAFEAQQAEQREKARIENEARDKAHAEAQAKINAERKEIEDAKLETERAKEAAKQEEIRKAKEAAEEARRRGEAVAAEAARAAELEEAKKRAAEEAVAKAERERVNAERIKREDEERAEQERKRKEAMAPDKEKAKQLVCRITEIELPDMKSKEGKAVVEDTRKALAEMCQTLTAFHQGK